MINGRQPSFSDVVAFSNGNFQCRWASICQRPLAFGFPEPFGLGSQYGYQPYIQFPWSHEIVGSWGMAGMFTVTWFPSESARNPTFEPTISLEKAFGRSADMFFEYVGDYDHQRPSQVLDTGGGWRFTKTQQLDFHAGVGSHSKSVDHYLPALIFIPPGPPFGGSTAIHPDLLAFGRVFCRGVRRWILDVFAISLAVGTAQLNRNASMRVGMAFASAEIVMQRGWLRTRYRSRPYFRLSCRVRWFALLAFIGVMTFGNSFRHSSEAKFDATHGVGPSPHSLRLSISLDSLGIGIALPALGIPLLPLLTTVSMTTTVFTLIGLSFGARLGERYERNAERAAGMILVLLAVVFAFQRMRSRL